MPHFKFQEAFYDQKYLEIGLDSIYNDILSKSSIKRITKSTLI